jgi:hypothetical protein
MGANWEETLAAATAKGSNVVPGVVLAAVNKKGKSIPCQRKNCCTHT